MDLDDTLSDLLSLARRHFDTGASVYSLLKSSRYFERYAETSENRIHEALTRHPEHAKEWIGLSEDKRTSGWYIISPSGGTFEVGYNLAKGEVGKVPSRYFRDELEACAAFIKLEVEDIRLRHCVRQSSPRPLA